MTPARRIVLTCYGLAVAFVFLWVPWCGVLEARNGKTRDFLGYSLVWSMPKPSAASVKYETALGRYTSNSSPPPGYYVVDPPKDLGFVPSDPLNLKSGIVKKQEQQKPEEPEGYISSFVYKQATVDYGRVLLEFGALTGLLLMGWTLSSVPRRIADQN